MIVIMDITASIEQIEDVNKHLIKFGFQPYHIKGIKKIVIGAVGDRSLINLLKLEAMPGVEKVIPIMKPYKLVSRIAKQEDTVINIIRSNRPTQPGNCQGIYRHITNWSAEHAKFPIAPCMRYC